MGESNVCFYISLELLCLLTPCLTVVFHPLARARAHRIRQLASVSSSCQDRGERAWLAGRPLQAVLRGPWESSGQVSVPGGNGVSEKMSNWFWS